jgi:[ribosomal protein S5]-alanine N-acetyltransferase
MAGHMLAHDRSDWLTTERLALRCFTPDDLDWFAALYTDPEVTRYVGGTRDRAGAEQLLHERVLEYYQRHPGLGVWMTTERATSTPVGFHLLNHIRGESLIQVGYVLLKPAWGKGYATEMARALLHHGFATLGLPHICAITNLPHEVSQKVLLKIGLHRNGERLFAHPFYAAQGPMAYFERHASDWLAEGRITANDGSTGQA